MDPLARVPLPEIGWPGALTGYGPGSVPSVGADVSDSGQRDRRAFAAVANRNDASAPIGDEQLARPAGVESEQRPRKAADDCEPVCGDDARAGQPGDSNSGPHASVFQDSRELNNRVFHSGYLLMSLKAQSAAETCNR